MGALAKMAAKPLRTGVDPLVPSSGTPGAVTPGTDSWQKAYPLLFGTRKVPLPPMRPGSLPTSGALSGIDSINSILGPSVQAAKGVRSLLDAMSVVPSVDTASVDAAKVEVRELIALLASVPGGVATAKGAVEGGCGRLSPVSPLRSGQLRPASAPRARASLRRLSRTPARIGPDHV